MLRQLGIDIEFLPSTVSIGIGAEVVRVSTEDSLAEYQALLGRQFPGNREDVARIIGEVRRVMGYMDVLYGIDNPLFLDLKSDPKYLLKTILPWMLKYALTMPKIARLALPVDEYLARFSDNQALLDIIEQHFFQKTPTFFALSYFSLYLDYLYPRGGTGTLPRKMGEYIIAAGGQIRCEVQIAGVDLGSLPDGKARRNAEARKASLSGKKGGDSVFTLYLALNIDKSYFSQIASAHFFYTPSRTGLSAADIRELANDGPAEGRYTRDKARIIAWTRRYFELTTYEISCPALRDASLAPEGQTGLIVSTLMEHSIHAHVRELGWHEEYQALCRDCILEVLGSTIFPGLKDSLIDLFSSTPLSLERITGNSDGAITGWAFTNDPLPAVNRLPAVARSIRTPFPDVYQAGQWTFSPSGLPISILTGKLAADRALKDLG